MQYVGVLCTECCERGCEVTQKSVECEPFYIQHLQMEGNTYFPLILLIMFIKGFLGKNCDTSTDHGHLRVSLVIIVTTGNFDLLSEELKVEQKAA